MSDGKSVERIIIFYGKSGTEVLKVKKTFSWTGHLKAVVSSSHKCIDFGSSKEETNIHPVAFALLPNKNKQTYVRLFQSILKIIPEWKPRNVNVDVEAAVISAFEVFPLVEIHGRYFQMKKCVCGGKFKNLDLLVCTGKMKKYNCKFACVLHGFPPNCRCCKWLGNVDTFQASNAARLTNFSIILLKDGWKMPRSQLIFGPAMGGVIEPPLL